MNKLRDMLGLLLAVMMATALAACSTTKAAPPLTAAAAALTAGDYRLGLGDKLRISVYGERDLSGEFQVSGAGTVTVPLIGAVPVLGKTAKELQVMLVERFSPTFLRDPSITVEVYDFRPYYVLGEVAKPGRYPAAEGTTLLGAIATAGGYTYRAQTKKVFIRKAGDKTEYETDPNAAVIVGPGDVIRVGERHF